VLVLTTEMFAMFDRGQTSAHFSLVDLASHGLMVAREAWKTAEADPSTKHLSGVAFSASILRDVGQIVMATALPDTYDTAFLYARTKSVPFHHAERLLLRFTHFEIGAYLLALWGLPEPIVDAVAFHHFHHKRRRRAHRWCRSSCCEARVSRFRLSGLLSAQVHYHAGEQRL